MHKHIRQATQQDFATILDLIYYSFAEETLGEVNETEGAEVKEIFDYYFRYYQPADIFVAELDGQIVSMAGTVRCTFSHAGGQLQGGLINPVATHPQYRNQGLAAQCIQALLEELRSQGVSLLYLQGHPGYYPRLGFVPGYHYYQSRIASDRLLKIESNGQLSPATPADIDDLLPLYTSHRTANLLQIDRDSAWIAKKFLLDGPEMINTVGPDELFFLKEEETNLGYAIIRNYDDQLFIEEVALQDQSLYPQLLKGIGELAQQLEKPEVTFVNILPEDRLYRQILDLGGQSRVHDIKAYMFQILSLGTLFTSIQGLLEQRIADSKYAHSSFALQILCEDEPITLDYSPEAGLKISTTSTDSKEVSSAKSNYYQLQISKTAFTQLFTGYRQIHQLIEDGECSDAGEAIQELVDQLFPKVFLYYPNLHAN